MTKMNLKKAMGIGAFALFGTMGAGMIFCPKVQAQDIAVADSDAFWKAFKAADNGDVIKVSNDITIGNYQKQAMKSDTVLTIDLQGHELYSTNGGDNFEVGNNSVLLFKNGNMDYMDTVNSSNGIVILNNVEVTKNAWLGNTDTWIVNYSKVDGELATESAYVNNGASDDLNPLKPGYCASYNYANLAPAMVGSGTTWKCLATLQDDFDKAAENPTVFNRIILLNNATLTKDAVLSTPGVTLNLSGYKLTLAGHKLEINNADGTSTIANGIVDGDITMGSTGNGEVALDSVTVYGTISNNSHPLTITGGAYDTINAGSGTITIEDGYFGTLTGESNYIISGGYFKNEVPESLLKEGYECVKETKIYDAKTYFYKVRKHEHAQDTHYPAVAATCHSKGNIEYWVCEKDGVKIDAEGNVLDNVETAIDPDNHDGGTEIRDAKEATSVTEGYTGDTYCKGCGEMIKKGEVIAVKGDQDEVDDEIDARPVSLRLNDGLKAYASRTKLSLSWGRIKNADEYQVYAAYCGNEYKLVKTTDKNYTTIRELNNEKIKANEVYKFYVVALKHGQTIGRSISCHFVGCENTTYTNPKAVDVCRHIVFMKKGSTSNIKANLILQNRNRKALSEDHVATFRYVSDNEKVATVSKDGVITTIGRGHATIHVYSVNGCQTLIDVESI